MGWLFLSGLLVLTGASAALFVGQLRARSGAEVHILTIVLFIMALALLELGLWAEPTVQLASTFGSGTPWVFAILLVPIAAFLLALLGYLVTQNAEQWTQGLNHWLKDLFSPASSSEVQPKDPPDQQGTPREASS